MKKRLIIIIALLLQILNLAAAKIEVTVVDAQTGDSLPMVTLAYQQLGIKRLTNMRGQCSIERHEGHKLQITCFGYKDQEILINKETDDTLRIILEEDRKELKEVTVKSKKLRYSRKNNPAVELMRRVIAAKKKTRLENHDYYQYMKYQKLTMSLNDYKKGDLDSTTQKKIKWASHTEISPHNGKVIMPLSVNETVKQHIYRKDPKSEKDIIHGEQSSGLGQLLLSGENINTALKEVFEDVDIYDDYVRLLQFPFVSPIGKTAIAFYHFYIADTVKVENDSCYHLYFFPNNQQDIGFNGELFVLKDSSLHVKKCSLTLPKSSEVNFVDSMFITQQYTKLPNGEWVLTEDEMWAELRLMKFKLLVVRDTHLSDYAFDEISNSLLRGKAKTKTVANAHNQEDKFWKKYRAEELTEKESGLSSFMNQLKQSKAMRVPLFLIKALGENYIETGRKGKPSKFDIGQVISTFSHNFVDGFRIRMGGRTTGALNKHWFWRGYGAYGFKSNQPYYGSTLTYSFNKKRNLPFEFPQRMLVFESTYDVMSPADKFLKSNKDNVFLGLKTEKVRQMYFYNRQALRFTYETEYGLKFETSVKTESDEVAGDLHFIRVNDGTEVRKYRTTEWQGVINYCPGQTFIYTKQQRYPLNFDSPELTLRHTTGFKGFLGGQYRLNETELTIYKRQWLGSFGYIDLHMSGAIQWNKVPFPLLMTPPIDLSYIEQEGTFNMLHNMEMFMDRKVFWSLSWNLNGKLFNRIPLLKKLKLREYVAFKGIWGALSDKNNPTLAENATSQMLFQFPEGCYAIRSDRPYMEVVVGIHNILKFFSVDWVRRVNYTGVPHTKKNGVRFGLWVSF